MVYAVGENSPKNSSENMGEFSTAVYGEQKSNSVAIVQNYFTDIPDFLSTCGENTNR